MVDNYVVKDAWSTCGARTFSEPMLKLDIKNTGSSDIHITINNITILVKASESFEEVFDPFTQVIVEGEGSFEAIVSGLKSGAANPQLTAKDGFSGNKNMIRRFSGAVYGIAVSNDGNAPLSFSVNGITLTVPAGQVAEKYFDAFTEVSINSTVAFRAYVASGFQTVITGETVDTTPPLDVTQLNVTNVTHSSVTLTWIASASPDVASYDVYEGTALLVNVTGTEYVVDGLNENTGYTFTVKAKDTQNNSSDGASIYVTTAQKTDTTAPEPISNLTLGTITPTSIQASWTASVAADISSYEVAYSTDGNNYTVAGNVANVTHTITGLNASTIYTVRVVAVDTSGNRSIDNPTVSAVTASYAEVTFFAVTQLTDTSAYLAFTKAPDATGYEIYANNTLITTNPDFNGINRYSYNFTNLTPATVYTFKVIAVYSGGKSVGLSKIGVTKPTSTSTLDVIDTFNREDQDTLGVTESGHYWYSPNMLTNPTDGLQSTLSIKNGQAYNKGGTVDALSVTSNTKSDKIKIELDIAAYRSSAPSTPGIVFRMTNHSNFLEFTRYYGGLFLSKFVNGIRTELGHYLYNFNAVSLPHTLAIELHGNQIYCYMNGTKIMEASDSHNQNAHYHGIVIYNDPFAIVDNFKITDISVQPTPLPDTAPPDEVTNVIASPLAGGTSIKMNWTGSQDAYGYNIYVNGALNKTIMQWMNGGIINHNYTINGLTASTTYNIQIKAKDGFGNETSGVTVSSKTSA